MRYIGMKLFNFFRNTLQEVTIVKDGNCPNEYLNENAICKNYSDKNNRPFTVSGTPIGGTECTQYCKHCIGCTIRYTDDSVKDNNKIVQRFVKCKCGHNNIFNIWRRIKYVLSGKHVILKVITNDGIKQIK